MHGPSVHVPLSLRLLISDVNLRVKLLLYSAPNQGRRSPPTRYSSFGANTAAPIRASWKRRPSDCDLISLVVYCRAQPEPRLQTVHAN